MICICCLDRCTFKKQLSGRVDYGFHCYMEICQFVYCLLSRTRELTDLPELNDWAAYMDSEKIKEFRKIDTASFLLNYEFGEELQRGSTGELKEFRNRCREFMDRLVDVLLENNLVSSDFLQGAYCFCPELLLEGYDRYIFQMFSKLVQVLERSGALSCEEAKSGTEEFMTFVVDARLCHDGSESSAENISDVVTYLLSDYSLLSRKNLCRIFKLCYLVIRRPTCDFLAVLISLSGCVVPDSVVSSCLRGVQSYVCASSFKVQSLFTQHTMGCVLDSISKARDFMVSAADFDPWARVCTSDRSSFVQRYSELFSAHLDQKKEASYQRFRTANQRVRSGVSCVGQAGVSLGSSKGRTARSSSVTPKAGKSSLKQLLRQGPVSSGDAAATAKGGKKKSKKQPGNASGSKKN